MPIRYYISPELNVILYIGEGLITGSEFFKAADLKETDERRKWGMVSILDTLSAEADFELEDMHSAIEYTNNLSKKNLEPEQITVLTNSKGIELISNALKLLPSKTPIKLDVFYTLDDLISSLGFSERKQEFIRFYNECKRVK